MHAFHVKTRIAVGGALVAALAACGPPPAEFPTGTLGPGESGTIPSMDDSTPTPTPVNDRTPTSTPRLPTSTLAPTASLTASPIPVPTATPASMPVRFFSFEMFDDRTGWAAADLKSNRERRLFHSLDGGVTWQDVSPIEADLSGSFSLDGQRAWAWTWGQEPAWLTVDGGQAWEPLGEWGGQAEAVFVDGQNGWKLEAEVWGLSFVQFDINSFSSTQDGGMTWREASIPPEGGVAYMAYPDERTAWAVRAGFAKTIYGVPNLAIPVYIVSSTDGGGSWLSRQMPLPAGAVSSESQYGQTYLGGVGNCDFVAPVYSSTSIWKVALTCEDASWMYTTTNQGRTWIISDMPAGLNTAIDFVDASTGWLLVGNPTQDHEGRLYRTADGGDSWNLIKRTGWLDAHLSFVDDQTGWAVACTVSYCYQTAATQSLVRTTDGGETWEVIEPQFIPRIPSGEPSTLAVARVSAR